MITPRLAMYPVQGDTVALRLTDAVHAPSCDSLLLANTISSPGKRGAVAVDVGCGSGLLAIAMVLRGWQHVLAVDIAEEAVELTLQNLRRNVPTVVVRAAVGDLLRDQEPASFDLIVSNPPARPSANPTRLPQWNQSGTDGMAVVRRLLTESATALRPAGKLMFTLSSLLPFAQVRALASTLGFSLGILVSMEVPFRPTYFYEFEHLSNLQAGEPAMFRSRHGVPIETVSVIEAQRE